MMVRLNDLTNGVTVLIRFVFQLKPSNFDFHGEAKKLRGDSHHTHTVKSQSVLLV